MDARKLSSTAMDLLASEVDATLPEMYRLILELTGYMSFERAMDFNVLMLGRWLTDHEGTIRLKFNGTFPQFQPFWATFECAIPARLYVRLNKHNLNREYPSYRSDDPFAGSRLFNRDDGIPILAGDVFFVVANGLAALR